MFTVSAARRWRSVLPFDSQKRQFSALRTSHRHLTAPQVKIQALASTEGTPALRPPPTRPPAVPSSGRLQQRNMAAMQQAAAAAAQQASRKIKLAVVGDVHSQWDADSEAALQHLGADVAVFVGDFGEEAVQLIKQIAAVPHPKAVILGNHDAWFSLTKHGRKRYARAMLASSSLATLEQQQFNEAGSTPAIAAQLEALGEDHVGYASKRFPGLGLTLLGGRPFSKGSKQWSDVKDFYAAHYGVAGMQDSAHRMLDVALAAPEGDVKVLVAHNGPAGLGARRFSICGVDWTEPEADFGDPDLQEALDMMWAQGLRVPLVLFGHMHSQLKGSGLRNMVEVDSRSGTVYLNAAVVPRIRSLPLPSPAPPADGGNGSSGGGDGGSSGGSPRSGGSSGGSKQDTVKSHHFLVVELQQGVVAAARDVWVGVRHDEPLPGHENGSGAGEGSSSKPQCLVMRQQELVKTSLTAAAVAEEAGGGSSNGRDGISGSDGSYVCSIYRAHTGEWEPFVLQLPAAAAAAQLADCC